MSWFSKKNIIIFSVVVLAITLIVGAFYYWQSVVQDISYGKTVKLNKTFTLKAGDQAYLKSEQIQLKLDGVAPCPKSAGCISADDVGANLSAKKIDTGSSTGLYLSQKTFSQTNLFDLQIQLIKVDEDQKSLELKIFK